jgi:hypothetical protein
MEESEVDRLLNHHRQHPSLTAQPRCNIRIAAADLFAPAKEFVMNLKLLVAILVIAAMPGWVQAQTAVTDEGAQHETLSGDKAQSQTRASTGDKAQSQTNDDPSQRAFETISGDKTQTKSYCDIVKLTDQVNQANQKGDTEASLKLAKQIVQVSQSLDPQAYRILMPRLSSIPYKDVEAKLGLKPDPTILPIIDKLDELCESMQQESDEPAGSESRSDNTDDNRQAR